MLIRNKKREKQEKSSLRIFAHSSSRTTPKGGSLKRLIDFELYVSPKTKFPGEMSTSQEFNPSDLKKKRLIVSKPLQFKKLSSSRKQKKKTCTVNIAQMKAELQQNSNENSTIKKYSVLARVNTTSKKSRIEDKVIQTKDHKKFKIKDKLEIETSIGSWRDEPKENSVISKSIFYTPIEKKRFHPPPNFSENIKTEHTDDLQLRTSYKVLSEPIINKKLHFSSICVEKRIEPCRGEDLMINRIKKFSWAVDPQDNSENSNRVDLKLREFCRLSSNTKGRNKRARRMRISYRDSSSFADIGLPFLMLSTTVDRTLRFNLKRSILPLLSIGSSPVPIPLSSTWFDPKKFPLSFPSHQNLLHLVPSQYGEFIDEPTPTDSSFSLKSRNLQF